MGYPLRFSLTWRVAAKAAIEYLLVRPIQGLVELFGGLVQIGTAVIDGLVDAVRSNMSAAAQDSFREGTERAIASLRLLAPLGFVLLGWFLVRPSLLYLACEAALLATLVLLT